MSRLAKRLLCNLMTSLCRADQHCLSVIVCVCVHFLEEGRGSTGLSDLWELFLLSIFLHGSKRGGQHENDSQKGIDLPGLDIHLDIGILHIASDIL